MGEAKEDPLADLRQGRGWIEHVPEAELWELLRRVRWAHGLCCPHCGESDPAYLEVIDRCRYGDSGPGRAIAIAPRGI